MTYQLLTGRVAHTGTIADKVLLVLVCVAVFLACFGGALVATQQLH